MWEAPGQCIARHLCAFRRCCLCVIIWSFHCGKWQKQEFMLHWFVSTNMWHNPMIKNKASSLKHPEGTLWSYLKNEIQYSYCSEICTSYSLSFKVQKDNGVRIKGHLTVFYSLRCWREGLWDSGELWMENGSCCSGSEHVHCPHHVLPADRTFAHALAALCACDHVSALQKNTVNGWVHTDLTQVLLHGRPRSGIYKENRDVITNLKE